MSNWKKSLASLGDSEIIRMVMSDQSSTDLERHLAMRLDRILYRCDELEDDLSDAAEVVTNLASATAATMKPWEQLELFPKDAS